MAAEQSTQTPNLNEIWKPIPGYEGFYEVSDQGRVRSLDHDVILHHGGVRTQRGKILSPHRRWAKEPYLKVNLNKFGDKKTADVHVLVCTAFHGERPDGMHVRHLNGDATDNRAVNLAWGTVSENAIDTVRHGANWQTKKTSCPAGHPYDDANTIYYNGWRYCRECRNRRRRAKSFPAVVVATADQVRAARKALEEA